MRDLAILKHIADILGEPLFIFTDDFKDYFNQLKLRPMASSQSTVLLRSAAGSVEHVVEEVLGFGHFAASNVAQRWAHAKRDMLQARLQQPMKELDEKAAASSPDLKKWLQERTSLPEPLIGKTEARLHTMHIYTDDVVGGSVGVERTVLYLRHWVRLVRDMRTYMAIPQKRQVGTSAKVWGAKVFSDLGLAVTPTDKLLRAEAALSKTASGSAVQVGEYRSLLGLLEHLTYVFGGRRRHMYGMYYPFTPGGAAERGPDTKFYPNRLVRLQADCWLRSLRVRGGAHFTAVVQGLREAVPLTAAPSVLYFSQDAAVKGDGHPGLGGYMHGLCWQYRLTKAQAALPIALLEFVAYLWSIIIFASHAAPLPSEPAGLRAVVAESDALAPTMVLQNDAAKSLTMQYTHAAMDALPQYKKLRPVLHLGHLYGPGNWMSDPLSRGQTEAFLEQCRLLHIKPTWLDIPQEALDLLDRVCAFHAASPEDKEMPAPSAPEGPPPEHLESPPAAPQPSPPEWEPDLPATPSPPPSPPPVARPWQPTFARSLLGVPASPPAPSQGARLAQAPRLASLGKPPASQAWWQVGGAAPPAKASKAESPWSPAFSRPLPGTSQPARPHLQHPQPPKTDPPPAPRPVRVEARPLPRFPSQVAPPQSAKRPLSSIAEERAAHLVELLMQEEAALAATVGDLTALVRELLILVEAGAASGTVKGEKSHWRWWMDWCRQHGADPWRLTPAQAQTTPLLFALALPWIHARMAPKLKEHQRKGIPAQPQSALNVLLGVRRMHKRLGCALPPMTLAVGAMKGMLRDFVQLHGSRYLAKKKALAFSNETVKDLCSFSATHQGSRVAGREVGSTPYWEAVSATWSTQAQSGLRKDEVSTQPGMEWDKSKPSRASVQWLAPGERQPRAVHCPLQLAALPWDSTLVLTPPPSKCDPFGIIWGSHPILLPLDRDAPICAARDIRKMCISSPCVEADAEDTPLFADPGTGKAFSAGHLDHILQSTLRVVLGSAQEAALYTVHSFRRYLATALVNAKLPAAVIQAHCRWQTPQSVLEYGQMDRTTFAANLAAAAVVQILPTVLHAPPVDPEDLDIEGLMDPALEDHAHRFGDD
jgi:hypothetical protein